MAARKPSPASSRPRVQSDDGNYVHPDSPHQEQPGERRAIWILTRMEAMQEDPDKMIDARDLLGSLPTLSQRYLAHILREGPRSNADAATALGVETTELEPAVKQLEAVIKEICEDDD